MGHTAGASIHLGPHETGGEGGHGNLAQHEPLAIGFAQLKLSSASDPGVCIFCGHS